MCFHQRYYGAGVLPKVASMCGIGPFRRPTSQFCKSSEAGGLLGTPQSETSFFVRYVTAELVRAKGWEFRRSETLAQNVH
jgi:hypothetical protein